MSKSCPSPTLGLSRVTYPTWSLSGAAALARALAEPTCALERVDISNTGIQRAGLRLIAAAVSKRKRLREIKVDDNECSDAIIDLAMVCSLTRLSLRNTGMSDPIANKLSQQLALDSQHDSLEIDCGNNAACSANGRSALQGLSKLRRNISVLV